MNSVYVWIESPAGGWVFFGALCLLILWLRRVGRRHQLQRQRQQQVLTEMRRWLIARNRAEARERAVLDRRAQEAAAKQ